MKRYAKFGYAAPFRFRVILEKPQGGAKMTPPPTRAKVNSCGRGRLWAVSGSAEAGGGVNSCGRGRSAGLPRPAAVLTAVGGGGSGRSAGLPRPAEAAPIHNAA